MQALISTLPKPYEDMVLALWDELEERFGLRYVRQTPMPHFTWQMGESYDMDKVVASLDALSAETEPFDISVKGVESFISQAPIVFLRILPQPSLIRLHDRLWFQLHELTLAENLLYSPSLWQPHITLAMQDLNWDGLKPVLDFLFAKEINWRFMIDHFSILSQGENGGLVLEKHFQFGKGLIY